MFVLLSISSGPLATKLISLNNHPALARRPAIESNWISLFFMYG